MINKYPGTCGCGTRVEAGAGEAVRVNGRWTVRCASCCDVIVEERPARETKPQVSETDGYTLLSGHRASAHQAAVFDHFKTGRGSVIVKAVAGSGKTTTMKNALRYLPEWAFVQLLAFNVKAANQLKEAIEELEARGEKSYRRVRAGTFHSVAHRAVAGYLRSRGVEVTVDRGKLRKILREKLGETLEGQETLVTYGAFAEKLVGLARGEGVGTCLAHDTPDAWLNLVDHHGLYLDSLDASVERGVEVARRLLEWSNEAAETGLIDHDDQLYLVIRWRLGFDFRNHVVIVDEAQDTNPVRRAIAHLLLRDGGRLYAVGDEKQSIYGFTGASTDAMDLIRTEFNCRELPLTVSYRCAKRVVERAQTWVPYIEAFESAPEGEVHDDVPLAQALGELTASDAILCRQTAPLVSVAYGLIARGRACQILGREIGEGLVNLIRNQHARGIDGLTAKLEEFKARETAKFIAKGEENRAEAVADRVDCVFAIVEALGENERTVPALIRKIETMFVEDGEKRDVLTLCTVHKAKGLEWDRVAILRPELMPSKAARQDWAVAQEYNLLYVAATRAKSVLIYVQDEDMKLGEQR